MIKHVIFDFDGTIADSKEVFVSAWNSMAMKHKFKMIKIEELDEMRRMSIRERSEKLNFPMYKMPIIMPQFYKRYRQAIQDIHLFPQMNNVLNELDGRGVLTAIISSNSEENIRAFLLRNEIKSVTKILCSSRIFGKDTLIKRFLKQQNLKPEEVIYVGDEHRDIVACKKAGIKVIWVGWGFDAEEVVKAAEPDFMVYEPVDILRIV
ncbi:HAD-IA family hydrolase [Cytobacillus oceanisediminis]|uniref:HAD-IA family hydrolase n=1 Tax=Cytobacillus oceanisediminis TaxID=665099 RepID=UPI0037368266